MSVDKEKVSIMVQNMIAENPSLDFTANSNVITATATALDSKSSSGAPVSPWAKTELTVKIWQCISILEHDYHKVNQSNILRLLGFDKSTIYKWDNGSVQQKVSELINQVIHLDKDPGSTEHIEDTMSTDNMGSKPSYEEIALTNNQQIFSALLLPIFDNRIASEIKIGTDETSMLSTNKLMEILITMVLIRDKWFHSSVLQGKILKYTQHLNTCILLVVSRASISSKNPSFDYLQRHDKKYSFSNLIGRYGNYLPGRSSYKYRLTPMLTRYLQESIELLNLLDLEFCNSESIEESDLLVAKDMMRDLDARDIYILMNHLEGVDENDHYIIKNSQTITDRQESRVYSLMTSLKSETRVALGYINYDISTCMQTIVSHFVAMENYPLHQQLIEDKRSFRSLLAEELDKDVSKVKEMLSASDNGKKYTQVIYDRSASFKSYVDETEPMVEEFIDYFRENNPEIITTATSYAKKEWEIIDWESREGHEKQQPVLQEADFKKFSIFFFVWTQIERQIRNAMKSCFSGFVHEVHDAVYSKEDIELGVLEKAVLDQTGLVVKIEY